jgi:hypothetical protein
MTRARTAPRAGGKPQPTAAAEPAARPDRPSWFDGLTAAVERLPVPYWGVYALGFVIWLGFILPFLGQAGLPLSIEVLYAHSLPFYGLWLLHHLDRRGAASLEDFRPAFTGDDQEVHQLRVRLTTLPLRRRWR